MKVYTLKNGKQFSLSRFPRERDGEVVFFTLDEWSYIKECRFSDPHKNFLWEQKYLNPRYPIIPEKGLTEPEVARKYCREILEIFNRKKVG